MTDISQIKEDQIVFAKGESVSSTGVHVGTVDHMDGQQYIKLAKKDSQDGQHHWIPVDWVEKVDDKTVYLSKTKEEFQKGLLNDPPVLH